MKYQLITPIEFQHGYFVVEELKKVVAVKEQKLKHRGLALFQEVRHHKIVIKGPVKLLQIMRLV
jgi:hypothetical protein